MTIVYYTMIKNIPQNKQPITENNNRPRKSKRRKTNPKTKNEQQTKEGRKEGMSEEMNEHPPTTKHFCIVTTDLF